MLYCRALSSRSYSFENLASVLLTGRGRYISAFGSTHAVIIARGHLEHRYTMQVPQSADIFLCVQPCATAVFPLVYFLGSLILITGERLTLSCWTGRLGRARASFARDLLLTFLNGSFVVVAVVVVLLLLLWMSYFFMPLLSSFRLAGSCEIDICIRVEELILHWKVVRSHKLTRRLMDLVQVHRACGGDNTPHCPVLLACIRNEKLTSSS